MAKPFETDNRALQAVLTGRVTRVAKLIHPSRTEFTIDAFTTKIGKELFSLGTKVTFEIDNAILASGHILASLTNLAVGDRVEVTVEKQGNKWNVIGLSNTGAKGRPVDEFLNDLEEEMRRRS